MGYCAQLCIGSPVPDANVAPLQDVFEKGVILFRQTDLIASTVHENHDGEGFVRNIVGLVNTRANSVIWPWWYWG